MPNNGVSTATSTRQFGFDAEVLEEKRDDAGAPEPRPAEGRGKLPRESALKARGAALPPAAGSGRAPAWDGGTGRRLFSLGCEAERGLSSGERCCSFPSPRRAGSAGAGGKTAWKGFYFNEAFSPSPTLTKRKRNYLMFTLNVQLDTTRGNAEPFPSGRPRAPAAAVHSCEAGTGGRAAGRGAAGTARPRPPGG